MESRSVKTYRYLHSSSEEVFSPSENDSSMVDCIDLGSKKLKRHLSRQTLELRLVYSVCFDGHPMQGVPWKGRRHTARRPWLWQDLDKSGTLSQDKVEMGCFYFEPCLVF